MVAVHVSLLYGFIVPALERLFIHVAKLHSEELAEQNRINSIHMGSLAPHL